MSETKKKVIHQVGTGVAVFLIGLAGAVGLIRPGWLVGVATLAAIAGGVAIKRACT